MRIVYTSRNIEITDALKNLTEDKLEKIDKYFEEDIEIHVTYRVQNKTDTAEITIHLPGTILRSEESTDDMYESIDNAVEKLERQIRKYKTRLKNRQRAQSSIRFENIEPLEKQADEEKKKIVKRKEFFLNPMTEEEAVLQMELLGHNFFVYMDGDTGQVNVVYKRKDNNYGLIVPKL